MAARNSKSTSSRNKVSWEKGKNIANIMIQQQRRARRMETSKAIIIVMGPKNAPESLFMLDQT